MKQEQPTGVGGESTSPPPSTWSVGLVNDAGTTGDC